MNMFVAADGKEHRSVSESTLTAHATSPVLLDYYMNAAMKWMDRWADLNERYNRTVKELRRLRKADHQRALQANVGQQVTL